MTREHFLALEANNLQNELLYNYPLFHSVVLPSGPFDRIDFFSGRDGLDMTNLSIPRQLAPGCKYFWTDSLSIKVSPMPGVSPTRSHKVAVERLSQTCDVRVTVLQSTMLHTTAATVLDWVPDPCTQTIGCGKTVHPLAVLIPNGQFGVSLQRFPQLHPDMPRQMWLTAQMTGVLIRRIR